MIYDEFEEENAYCDVMRSLNGDQDVINIISKTMEEYSSLIPKVKLEGEHVLFYI